MDDDKIIFSVIGRIIRDKGINEIFSAAKKIRKEYPKTEFRLIGDYDEKYEDEVLKLEKKGIINYLGYREDIHMLIAQSHAIIHASHHEGMSNVLLEAAAIGRPVIASDVHGCIETYEPSVTGISFKVMDSDSLVEAIEAF